ncbi:MAG: hypothetical protein H3C43_02870 [Leptonema sp. (in: Bacteria)]|nr:hypothetical protein [Leptonema sp. (in: bacteria)]
MFSIRPLLTLSVSFLLLMSFLSCKKDESQLPQKLMTYQLLCPGGIDGCYSSCGDPTGANWSKFQSCTNQCDIACDISFLLLADD